MLKKTDGRTVAPAIRFFLKHLPLHTADGYVQKYVTPDKYKWPFNNYIDRSDINQ